MLAPEDEKQLRRSFLVTARRHFAEERYVAKSLSCLWPEVGPGQQVGVSGPEPNIGVRGMPERDIESL